MSVASLPTTKLVASDMAKEAAKDDPAIVEAFMFPSDTEVRLVYVDITARPSSDSQRIMPFYFGADAAHGVPYPSAVALILPEEKNTLHPPEEWGTWDKALSVSLQQDKA